MFKSAKKISHVLDVGSQKLWLLSGAVVSGKLTVLAENKEDYAGFLDGEFLEEDRLVEQIGEIVTGLEIKTGLAVKKIGVSVPSEFCYSITKKVNVTFARQNKLTKELLDEIYESAVEVIEGYTPINIEPIVSILDDGKKVISALNAKTTKLSVLVNVIYAKKSFIKLFNHAFSLAGVDKVNYINSQLAITQSLLGDCAQKVCVVDIGYLTSSVAFARGRGIENMYTFSIGGGQIEVDLMDAFALTLPEAQNLKKTIVLSLDTKNAEFYETSNLGKTRKILTHSANQVVFNRLEELAYIIGQCIEKSEAEISSIYLTGGGITQIQGAKDFLAEKLGLTVNILSPDILGYNKPYQSSFISLLISQISQ